MNNEIGRKITSLTLMTIMLAGGLTIAAPSMMPAAHAANANLFVSAENSQFDNYMSGPQVIEVVVIDSDINDTDENKGEPDVTVNGKRLRMVQAVDGNWYGYFADRDQAQIADSTVGTARSGVGLDFGTFCSRTTAIFGDNFFTETNGVALPVTPATDQFSQGRNGTSTGGAITEVCTAASLYTNGGTEKNGTMNVVREAKAVNTNTAVAEFGQIIAKSNVGIDKSGGNSQAARDGWWPFVQLYTLNPTGNVVIQYNKGGGAQTTTLTFDTVDNFAGIELDRAKYPQNSQVHATITDLWLNIDPTDEDSWTFGTNATNNTSTARGFGTYYQVFDENGASGDPAADNSGIINIVSTLDSLMCEDNCILKLTTDAQGSGTDVVTIQDNDDSIIDIRTSGSAGLGTLSTETPTAAAINTGATLGRGSLPVTITEQGPNSGVFGTYDESDTSVLRITTGAERGTSASLDYNETPTTVLVGFSFATIDIQAVDDEWNSGEEIPIVIVDGDANKNSRADEDLDLNNADVALIPSLRTEDPFTLAENSDTDGFELDAIFTTTTLVGNSGENKFLVAGQNGGTPLTGGNLTLAVDKFSKRGIVNTQNTNNTYALAKSVVIELDADVEDLLETFKDPSDDASGDHDFRGFNLLNIDLRGLNSSSTVDVYLLNNSGSGNSSSGQIIGTSSGATAGADGAQWLARGLTAISIANDTSVQSLTLLNQTDGVETINGYNAVIETITNMNSSDVLGLLIEFNSGGSDNRPVITNTFEGGIVVDFFSFGFVDDGLDDSERIANQIIRIEAEETGDNTSTFEGSLEYTMLNQLNILDANTYTGLSPIADDPSFIVHEDLDDEESPRVNYLDLGADGVATQVSDQQEAPAHSGVVSFDANNYKIADTVTITLEDQDLNVDSDLIDIFTVVNSTANISGAPDHAQETVGKSGLPLIDNDPLGRLLDVTFDDLQWKSQRNDCDVTLRAGGSDAGLFATGFTLVETGKETGVFVGDFQIPSKWCRPGATAPETATGLDIEVNYVDYRDASGETIEVGDSAGVAANTGSVSLDRTVYPVPFGVPDDFTIGDSQTAPDSESIFAIHATGIGSGETVGTAGKTLKNGDLNVHIRVNDPDFDISASGEDKIAQAVSGTDNTGPVKISVIRGSQKVVLGYAGGPSANNTGLIAVASDKIQGEKDNVRQFGPMTEIAPDAGIFEADIPIRYTDGPANANCPETTDYKRLDGGDQSVNAADTTRFSTAAASGSEYCILQGDILQVEYTDPEDASGDQNTVTDSATFDLRNGVLQSDKSVYIIGSDMILTLIEPDFDLDNDQAETYDLDLIEWDSDAATVTMGDEGGEAAAFDPEPKDFRETGDSTGIFQIVIEIPEELANDKLERGEEIVLEYTDWGPSGSDYVGQEDEDVNLTIYTSNFGATVELDQKVYSWTDKVYITIVAPDHNFDSDLVDEIGNTDLDPIKISTRGQSLDRYKLVETGTDTGIFTGEVILTGFSSHDADGDGDTGDATGITGDGSGNKNNIGPTNGLLKTSDDDGITVSFEFSEDETVVGSALIRWNIGEVQWLEASYPASGTGVVRVIDPDMNLDPESVDNFDTDVWSDSDAGGIDLTVTETNEATGIFEGTVFFTTTDESSGHRLRVAEGDTVTAEYEDNTLPDPYTTADELDITATSLIGTVVPPLERAPAANLRIVDAFGNSLDAVSVDQQVQITADLANGQDREQAFAYLVQIQDASGVTVSLAWITGSLSPGQSFSPALSWIPQEAGSYSATAFVWESVDNPTALSPPVTTTINVQ